MMVLKEGDIHRTRDRSLTLLLISINKIQIFHTQPRMYRNVIEVTERGKKNLKMIELTQTGFLHPLPPRYTLKIPSNHSY